MTWPLLPLLALPLLLLVMPLQSALGWEDVRHWHRAALKDLEEAQDVYRNIKNYRAKNGILFLGDGMGMTSVTAGRILKGQLKSATGEEEVLSFERFPHTGLAKTYNTDMQTPDSAGTATAFLCGVKAKSGTLGVNDLANSGDCRSQTESSHVQSFLTEAQRAGKSVGIVTTTRVTHATPGAAYAHVAWRDWEDDTRRNKDVANVTDRRLCPDIAQQLVDNAINFTVIFGGGWANFLPREKKAYNAAAKKVDSGRRSDSVDLINLWKLRQAAYGRTPVFLKTRTELKRQVMELRQADSVYLGLFAPNHLSFEVDRDSTDSNEEPTIDEMTAAAVTLLNRNPKGFALLVEGGRIDHGHHNNLAKKALHEVVALDRAVQTALGMTKEEETLTVVTADHSHVFSIGGWVRRGQPIFGKVDFTLEGVKNSKGETLSLDGMPYTPLFYGDGPSAVANGARANLTEVNTEDPQFAQQALVKFPAESHGAEDVPVYAQGPGAHLFHRTHEQSYIGNVFKHALCLGEFAVSGNCLADRR